MNHLSLFSGIGGLDLAAEWAGFTTVAFVERDPYCQRVLAKRWPGVPVYGDVRLVGATTFPDPRRDGCLAERKEPADGQQPSGGWATRGELESSDAPRPIRLISGGFPCQPHSVAGKRQASADDRDLWPEVARVLREIRPRWFVGENVRGLLHSESGRFFGRVLGDLADLGYRVGWGVWGASDVGALHQRERVFIVAYAGSDGGESERGHPVGSGEARAHQGAEEERQRVRFAANDGRENVADAGRQRGRRWDAEREDAADAWESSRRSLDRLWLAEPAVGRVADGVPSRVDRLRALGNAVVPQQAYPLFKAIADIERMT